jgi:hypothetical protein
MFGNATALSIDAGEMKEDADANTSSLTAAFQVRHPPHSWPAARVVVAAADLWLACCRALCCTAALPVHVRVPGDDHGCYANVSDHVDELKERCGVIVGPCARCEHPDEQS